jgi:hypothetical protein
VVELVDVDVFLTSLAGTNRRELTGLAVDEVKWTLNGSGGAKITCLPLEASAAYIVLDECELQIWMNGVYSHCVIPRTVGGNTQQVSYECEGLLSELHDGVVTTPPLGGLFPQNLPVLHWTGQEQFNIALELLDWWQSQPNCDRRIDPAFVTASGVFRSRTFYQDAAENLWDAFQEFPKLYLGFDFDIVLFGDGRREFTPYYPNKGSRKAQYLLSFDERGKRYVENIEGWKRSALNVATDVYNTGGNVTQDNPDPTPDETFKIVGHYEDAAASAQYRRKTKVISSGQIIDLGWLNDRAREEEVIRGKPLTTGEIAVSESLFGLITTGDALPVNVDYGVMQIKGEFGIMEITSRKDKANLLLSLQPA